MWICRRHAKAIEVFVTSSNSFGVSVQAQHVKVYLYLHVRVFRLVQDPLDCVLFLSHTETVVRCNNKRVCVRKLESLGSADRLLASVSLYTIYIMKLSCHLQQHQTGHNLDSR